MSKTVRWDQKEEFVPGDDQGFTSIVHRILGQSVHATKVAGVDLDTRQGPVHSTTSLPYQIHGTATVVSQKVGTWLASFQDPIRAILGTGIHKDQTIIIKRKYVVGSAATITPERAPARTVAIQEDVREVQLTRYGGDIEMNLNQFLVPGAAEEEMEMKVDAQKMELERALIDLGYNCVMEQGTNIVEAIMRSNPAFSIYDSDGLAAATSHATKIHQQQIFGAINKFRYPVTNLLAAAKYASAYSVGTQKGSVMILPHGIPDMLRYTRKEGMTYNISGLKETERGKKLSMALDDVYVDNASDVRILIHHPTPTYEHGAAHPEINGTDTGLSRTCMVGSLLVGNQAASYYLNGAGTSIKCSLVAYTAATEVADGKMVVTVDEAMANETTGPILQVGDRVRFPASKLFNGAATDSSPVTTWTDIKGFELKSKDDIAAFEAFMTTIWFTVTVEQNRVATGATFEVAVPTIFHEWLNTTSTDVLVDYGGGNVKFVTGKEFDVWRRVTRIPNADDDRTNKDTAQTRAMNLVTGEVEPVEYPKTLRLNRVIASSAILAAPGASTGELLIGFPFTSVSTSQSDERMRIQLRCYLGAVLYQPDNVIVMPDVHIDGIPGQYSYNHNLISSEVQTHMKGIWEKGKGEAKKGLIKLCDIAMGRVGTDDATDKELAFNEWLKSKENSVLDLKRSYSNGATFWQDSHGQYNQLVHNTSEFGSLDHPDRYMGLHGVPTVYERGEF